MATPVYNGKGQPTDTGLFGSMGAWLGGGTPAYRGAGQPGSTGGAAYKPAPPPPADPNAATAPATCPDPFGPNAVAIVVPSDLIEPQQ